MFESLICFSGSVKDVMMMKKKKKLMVMVNVNEVDRRNWLRFGGRTNRF